MKYWLAALVVTFLAVLSAYLFHLNPSPIDLQLTPGQTTTVPLAVALIVALTAGAVLVALVAAAGATRRRWEAWRAGRAARRQARRAATTARIRNLVWRHDYAKARTELARSATGAPDAAQVALLAKAHLREGDVDTARHLLERALPEVGRDPLLLDLLATAARRGGDHKAAVAALELACETEPGSPRFMRHLRDLYAEMGRWDDAARVQGDLVSGTHSPVTLAEEQQVLRGLRYQAALAEPDDRRSARELTRLRREDPDFTPAWVSEGDRLARAGKASAARRAWERGARHRPTAILLDRLEAAHTAEGHAEHMIQLYTELKRSHPEVPAVGVWFARHLLAQGGLEPAAAELEALPDPIASSGPVAMLWGDIHRARGEWQQAAEAYGRAARDGFGVVYRCRACGHAFTDWIGRCPACGAWGTAATPSELVAAAEHSTR